MGFRCKQFAIDDSQCAMKVGTDSLLLGSWVMPNNAQAILDIGTGSGLLAIMLAQKSAANTQITGIDINPNAIAQAKVNGQNCPWSGRLTFLQVALQAWQAKQQYDLIVSNPPYFPINRKANQLNAEADRQQARQTAELTHSELLLVVSQMLTEQGEFCCVLPQQVESVFCAYAEQVGLFKQHKLQIQTKPLTPYKRVLLAFSRRPRQTSCEQLSIYTHQGEYSVEYKNLCKAYYLNF